MQRWLSIRLSRKNGILANTRFLFPNEFLNFLYSRILENFDPRDVTDRNGLLWEIYQFLLTKLDRPDFRTLRHYLRDGNTSKAFRLAKRLASLFDQYVMYRSDWILKWEKKGGTHWQHALWHEIRRSHPTCSKAHIHRRFLETVDTAPASRFPERVSVFGISNLPPLHIELLQRIARRMEIDCYFLNPSREFWMDIRPKEKIARIERRNPNRELHLEEGNSLLASWGTAGREFIHLLMDSGLTDDFGRDLFLPTTSPRTLLAHMKNDIFFLRNPTAKTPIDRQDRSITIHSCHSRQREMEILHDRILELLNSNADLTPNDIVVMSPDIEEYVPHITAVFATGSAAGQEVPYSIADRGATKRGEVVPYFFKLLDVAKSRFTVSDVFDILDSESIREKFDISENDLEKIGSWITDVNIRWGIDRDFRSADGKAGVYHTTWQFGIDRILTGMALPLDERHLLKLPNYESILPYDGVEGSDTVRFGKFLDFFYKLVDLVRNERRKLDRSRTLEQWSTRLKRLLRDFFSLPDRQMHEYRMIREQLDLLENIQSQNDIRCRISFDVIVSHLKSKLEDQKSRIGFLGSGVTFCSMLPMRSIPFPVVFIVGLNDGIFPRRLRHSSFDLMASKRRLGDRSIREEDKYTFLEAILSAGTILSISYIGQNIKDNSTLPSSSLLNELLHYIDRGYRLQDGDLTDRLVTRHPLKAFSPRYFDGSDARLFSFSEENFRAARRQKRTALPDMPFLSSCPDFRPETVDADTLVRFFANPCKYLLNEGLGIFLEDKEVEQQEHELFSLDTLSSFLIQSELLRARYQPKASSDIKEIYRNKDRLPLQRIGDIQYRALETETRRLFELIDPYVFGKKRQPTDYDFDLGGLRFSGTIDNIWDGKLVRFSPVKCKTKQRLALWIDQLVLCRATGRSIPGIFISKAADYGKEKKSYLQLTCPRIEQPERHLEILVEYFLQGHRKPLPFFPDTSLQYVATRQKKTEEEAIAKTVQAWGGTSGFKKGEKEDAYIDLCFRHTTLFETEFREIGTDVLKPMIEAQHPNGK